MNTDINLNTQKLLIQYLLSSKTAFQLCAPIIKSEYFAPELHNTISIIIQYYRSYNAVPSVEYIKAETSITFITKKLTHDEFELCLDKVEKFCQDKALEHAIYDSVKLMQEGERSAIRKVIDDALIISLQKDIGLDYFKNIKERIERTFEPGNIQSTGWEGLDLVLFGGIVRKELVIFSAPSGGGKSAAMANLGKNFVQAGLNVAIITLELSQDLSSSRLDSIFSGVGRLNLKENSDIIEQRILAQKEDYGYGELFIKFMSSGSTCDDIRAYLKELELTTGVRPDMIIVDYLDLMQPNSKTNLDNLFLKDKYVSEELRNIGNDYNAFIISASQLNRSGVNQEKPDETMVAGGKSKFDTADTWISIVSNESMKAKGQCIFFPMKTRNSDGKGQACLMNWNNVSLLITDGKKVSSPIQQVVTQSKTQRKTPNNIETVTEDISSVKDMEQGIQESVLGIDWSKF